MKISSEADSLNWMKTQNSFLVLVLSGLSVTPSAYAYQVNNPEVLLKLEKLESTDFNGIAAIREFQAKFTKYKFTVEVVEELPSGMLSRMLPEFTTSGYEIRLKVHQKALKNSTAISEIIEELKGLEHLNGKLDLMRWVEYETAAASSNVAKVGLFLYEESAVYTVHGLNSDPETLFRILNSGHPLSPKEDYLKSRIEDLVKRRIEAGQKSAKSNREVTSIRDTLNEKVALGDRKGVARLLTENLPWDDMTPAEKTAYQRLVKSIEKPSGKKVILYRGTGAAQLPERGNESHVFAAALRKSDFAPTIQAFRSESQSDFYMPDLNSGRWVWVTHPSFSSGLRLHGHYSSKTPYISTSSSLGQAVSFAFSDGQKNQRQASVLILEIEEDRIIPNTASQFSENEYLVPFLIFPDEIKKNLYGSRSEIQAAAKAHLNSTSAKTVSTAEEVFKIAGAKFLRKITTSCDQLLE